MGAPVAEIRPNVKKAFLSNIVAIVIILLVIAFGLYVVNNVVGLKVFLDIFSEFGVEISITTLVFWITLIVVLVTVILMLLDYVALGKVRYTLYGDRIVYTKNLFIMELSEKTIPYANIAKITYEPRYFNSGKITLDLSGMKETKLEMDFIDNVEQVVKQIQDLIAKFKADYYSKYSQNQRVEKIVDGI